MTLAHRLLLKWARLIHVYVTLFGFVLMLFFAVTGFMLNHETWFLPSQTALGKIPTEMLKAPEDRDAIVEALRGDFGIPATMDVDAFDASGDPIHVTFRSKQGGAKAVIQRTDGATEVTLETDSQSRERVTIVEGKLPPELLAPGDDSKALPIVEKLRKEFGARGEVVVPPQYEKETESIAVQFKAPGYEANVTIRAGDGHTRVTHRSRGINGILLDLHRGKESGVPWSFIVDGVSVVFVIISITGLILWSSLRGRAQHGLAVLAVGLAVGLAVYFVWVPR